MSAPVLEVRWWDGSLIGYLVNRGTIYFAYDESWLKRGHNLSPLSLPLTTMAFNGAKGLDGLPGLIADCLPDAWGRRVAEIDFAKHKLGALSPLKLLAWRGDRGLGALRFHPALGADSKPLNAPLAAITAVALARGAAEIQRGETSAVLPHLARGGSAGGAYPKALVIAYADGTMRVGPPDDEGEPCLLKLDLSPQGGLAQREHAYALMSGAAGIQTVSTRLVAGEASQQHLLVRRFDIVGPHGSQRRLHFHSLSGMLHRDAGSLDYVDFFRVAIQLGVREDGIREIARRMLFNVLAANTDDHGKNHAFLYDEEARGWSLTPAYDVTFHSGILDRGMRVNGEVWPKLATMETLCREAGIARAEFRELAGQVDAAIVAWSKYARVANVPAALASEAAAGQTRVRAAVMPSKTVSQGGGNVAPLPTPKPSQTNRGKSR